MYMYMQTMLEYSTQQKKLMCHIHVWNAQYDICVGLFYAHKQSLMIAQACKWFCWFWGMANKFNLHNFIILFMQVCDRETNCWKFFQGIFLPTIT